MKRLIFILCLCSTVSIAYGQVKVSLSYQYGSYNVNSGNAEGLSNDYSGTAQANVMWQFSRYLSVFSGIGYNTNSVNSSNANYNQALERSFIFCGVGLDDEYYGGTSQGSFSNIEIPLGFRLNTPSFANFEMGLSAGMTTTMTTNKEDSYTTNGNDTYSRNVISENCFGTGNQTSTITTRTNSSSSRVDVALDIRYNLGLAWQISLAGTWSPYNLGAASTDNQIDEVADYAVTSRWAKNGQKGLRIEFIRSF